MNEVALNMLQIQIEKDVLFTKQAIVFIMATELISIYKSDPNNLHRNYHLPFVIVV